MTHVAITGASSGIGAALVAEFVRGGAAVSMVSRRRTEMEALAKEVGGRTRIFPVDLKDPAAATEWIALAEAALGPIDVLINNAGVQILEPSADADTTALKDMLTLNLTVPLLLTRAVLPGMLARGAGTIVDVSSMAALAPTPGMWGYNATKAGLAAASESLRGELRGTGVHVVTVYPGPVDTPMARAGYAAFPDSWVVRVLPQGTPTELARLVRSAVDLKQARIIYPRSYTISRYFPTVTRWFLDRTTPSLKPRDKGAT